MFIAPRPLAQITPTSCLLASVTTALVLAIWYEAQFEVFDATTVAILMPSIVLAALLIAAAKKKQVFPFDSSIDLDLNVVALQVLAYFLSLLAASVSMLFFCQSICWGDSYSIQSAFAFPKLSSGCLPGIGLALNMICGVLASLPLAYGLQLCLRMVQGGISWRRSFIDDGVIATTFSSIPLSMLILPFVYLCAVQFLNSSIFINEPELQAIRDASRLIMALSTIPMSFWGMVIAFGGSVGTENAYDGIESQHAKVTGGTSSLKCYLPIFGLMGLSFLAMMAILSWWQPGLIASFEHLIGQNKSAVVSFDRAIKSNGKDGSLYFQRAHSLEMLGRTEEASADYERAYALGTHTGQAYFEIIDKEIDEQKYVEALQLCSEAIEEYPEQSWLYNLRGRIKSRLGQREKALIDYSRAMNLYARCSSDFAARAEACDNLGRYGEAVVAASKAIELNPVQKAAFRVRSHANINLGRYREAIADANKLISLERSCGCGYYYRGRAFLGLGLMDYAEVDLDTAIAKYPDFGSALYYRSVLYERVGKSSLAARDRKQSEALGYSPELQTYVRPPVADSINKVKAK